MSLKKRNSREQSLPVVNFRHHFIDSCLDEFSGDKKKPFAYHSNEILKESNRARRSSKAHEQKVPHQNPSTAQTGHQETQITPFLLPLKWATRRSKSVQPTPDDCAIFRHLLLTRDLPVRIQHSSMPNLKPKGLIWTIEPSKMAPETIRFLIPKFCLGLPILDQPYRFIVETGISELISTIKSAKTLHPVLPQLIKAIRNGLYSSNEEKQIYCLKLLCKIANIQDVGPQLLQYYRELLPAFQQRTKPITDEKGSQTTKDKSKSFDDQISLTLAELERTGGQKATSHIKHFFPNYESSRGNR